MKRGVKVFWILMCILFAVALICIGVGIVLGGDFSAVLREITVDFYTRLQGTLEGVPFGK